MKTKLYIISIFILIASAGCEKFLEENPRDIISPGNFFSSEADAKAAITGIYAIMKNNSIYGQLGLDAWYSNGADIIGPNRSFGILEHICNYTINEGNAGDETQKMGIQSTWRDLSKMALNANIILANLEGNEAIGEAVRNELIGETLFLRALTYYHMTNLWGDVPYYREDISLAEIATLGRTDRGVIISDILDDLQRAQDLMPDIIESKENGRASSWVAALLMAKIYLIEENWQGARDKCVDIINNGPYELLDNYNDVFDVDNAYNAELMWCMDFAKDINSQYEQGRPDLAGNGWWWPSMFSPRLRDEPKNAGDKDTLVAYLNSRGEAFNGTGLQVCQPEFVKTFPMNDLRRELNVAEEWGGIPLVSPYMPKFWSINLESSPRFNHRENKIIYRLADVYLMAAEAENELNGPANAYQYINAVRERAFETQAESELSGLSQQEFREAIYNERKWELACEDHRRIDLIRWGILIDVIKAGEWRVYDPAANIQPHHVLLPIPVEELNLNPNLLTSDPTNNGYR